ncbi:PIR protein [Plasmodium yoelii]|uniref:PIR protein n=2 Tax=Plasmodium yoelii TaxID=5861 RepID=A0AAE9WSN8_PLAYO|nr:PIR protein [Plasmodium yoelii]WBY58266.1 PIR protein [Plasmodium yoelii yoelii]CDS44878.1 YIR protein [Plasmodium yoelii]VTZ79186.1 PIR protein [Plasmodium yoelii]|eukprot:XP_034493510.1 PIR protein [Plasmodium yoelii]
MDDDLCGKIDFLRKHFPDESSEKAEIEFKKISNFDKYCPDGNCNTELDKIAIGFLWLLEKYFTKYPIKGNTGYNTEPFFIYIILWLSNKLNQSKNNNTTNINDFYTQHVIGSNKHSNFKDVAYKFSGLEEFINKQKELLNINIKDLSKFYDASKLICRMYGNFATNLNKDELLNNANEFVIKYQELNGGSNNTSDSSCEQILSALSTDYGILRNKRNDITFLPEITANISALRSGYTLSSSSIGSKLFTVLSIFGAIAFFLGISYKYSLFGFRKRAQKQYLREKIKNIKKKMNR